MSTKSPASDGRANQKARTREALLHAAVDLVREGRQPSVPDAAERARISTATAYRYFPSADELWFEAAEVAIDLAPDLLATDERIEAAGSDLQARLEALVRTTQFMMLEDQAPFRRLAKGALDQWFEQADKPDGERVPVRTGRRKAQIAKVLEPLEGRMKPKDLARLADALTVVLGTDAMLALVDVAGLEGQPAKRAMVDSARWMLAGALAELDPEA